MDDETIFMLSEDRQLVIPVTEWVIYVPAEIRRIEVTDDVTR